MGGIKGSIFVPLGANIEVGLEAGYTAFATMTSIEYPAPAGDTDTTFYGGGFQGGAVLAIKF